jgi:hypothetical protein
MTRKAFCCGLKMGEGECLWRKEILSLGAEVRRTLAEKGGG